MSSSKHDWFFCLILADVTMLACQPARHGALWDHEANTISIYALQLLLGDWCTRMRNL